MASKYPCKCKTTSQTSGTGTLTLESSPTAARWQTPAQAFARGLFANGDTVSYYISDTGDPVLYEAGKGTLNSSGLTLSRDTVYESSSGTSKISWPSGGARDVVIGWHPRDAALVSNQGTDYTAATFATNLGLPRLGVENIFTAIQLVRTAGESQYRLDNTTAGRIWSLRNSTDGILRIRDNTAGVEPLTFGTGGTTAVVGATTTLSKSGGSSYENFPSGLELLANSVPPGWVRQNETTTDRTVRLATAADTLDALGGSWTISGLSFSGNTGSTALTIAQMPAHTHGIDNATGGAGAAVNVLGAGVTTQTQSTGGGAGHTHTISGSPAGDGNWRPLYRVFCRIRKT